MPTGPAGFGSGGGGGLTLGPAPNEFNAASKSAAETARDNASTGITGTVLAQYDATPTFNIILSWPVSPTPANTVYQARRGGSWADVTGIIRGRPGPAGAQGRFPVYAHINASVAPTVAPTGGTFVQSTDVLTVPTGYTEDPVTPAAGSKTYRAEAEVNPAVDADSVTLVWSVPAELPAYAAAELAETAADEADASAAAAAASAALVTSYSGAVPIIENVAFESNNLDFTVAGWREYDFLQFVVRDSNATEQIDRPAPQIPVAGLDTHGESRVPINNNDELRVERTAASDVLTVNITGWAGHPTTADVLTIYGIRSGVEAGGTPGTGGATDLTIENRTATTLDVASSTGDDATVPEASATEAGLLVAADKVKLNAVEEDGRYGGEALFGAVDPVATDGRDRDTWINTADGNIWKKAGGAWTNQYTYPSGGTPDPGDHTRRAAIAAGAALTEAEVTAGTSSMTQIVTTPSAIDWPAGTLRTLYLGVPEDEDAITDVEQGGLSVFLGYEQYEDAQGDPIIVSGHQWVRTTATQDGEFSAGQDLTIIQ